MAFRLTALLIITCLGLQAASPPNVVFIMADDLGYGDLGCYGSPDIRTPHLDQLAKEGIRFTDYYATGPTCSPTRAGFLTGRYPQRIGMDNALYYQEMGRGIDPEGRTLAHSFQAAGYTTGLSGKWHLGYDTERQPNHQGFNHFFGLLGGNHHYFQHMDRIGVHDLWLNTEPVKRRGYSTDLITEDALGFIRNNQKNPFFLYLSHAAPHFPWQGPGDQGKDIRPKHKSWQIGDRETYRAMVESMDAGIGRVLKLIDDLDLRGNTLVVFCSDNGGHTYSDNRPMGGDKATLWEGGIRVPCIARWPGRFKEGSISSAPVNTMDWSATFRNLIGQDVAAGDGGDVFKLLESPDLAARRTMFWRRKSGPKRKVINPGRAVRQGDWKLLQMENGTTHLFHISSDVSESTNLCFHHPDRVARLTTLLDEWEASIDRP